MIWNYFIIFSCITHSTSGSGPSSLDFASSALSPGVYQDLPSPCARELGGGNGRYPRAIAREFPHDVVRNSGLKQNLFCTCDEIYDESMECRIRVRAGSFEERHVRQRLSMQNEDVAAARMRPFYIALILTANNGGRPMRVILYEHPDCEVPRVVAQISVVYIQNHPLMRSASSPEALHYPVLPILLSVCTDGSEDSVCPIMHTDFKDRDIIYVLKSDLAKVQKGIHAPCFSGEGLRKLAASSPRSDRRFVDPLKRRGEDLLSITNDFQAMVISDDSKENSPAVPKTARNQNEAANVPLLSSPLELHPLVASLPSYASTPSDSGSSHSESTSTSSSEAQTPRLPNLDGTLQFFGVRPPQQPDSDDDDEFRVVEVSTSTSATHQHIFILLSFIFTFIFARHFFLSNTSKDLYVQFEDI